MATAAAIIATVGGVSESRKARKDQNKARKIQERSGRLQAGRQAVEGVRQAQIARANVVQQSETTGAGGSSAVAGALGSIQSQAGSNISFAQSLFNLSQQANSRLAKAAMHRSNAQAFEQIASMAANSGGGSPGGSPSGSTPQGVGTGQSGANGGFFGI